MMQKPKKSDIKKMIAGLHADPKGAPIEKEHHTKDSVNMKSTGGGKKAGTYRPKI